MDILINLGMIALTIVAAGMSFICHAGIYVVCNPDIISEIKEGKMEYPELLELDKIN